MPGWVGGSSEEPGSVRWGAGGCAPSSLLGLRLSEARPAAAAAGFDVEIERTGAPGKDPSGPWRVVRVRTSGSAVRLTVCREDWRGC